MTGTIGQMVDTSQVEMAMMGHIQLWLPRYLAVKDQQDGLAPGTTPTPRSWDIVGVFDESMEPQIPAIILISPGIREPPKKLGDGNVIAVYEINVAAIVTAIDSLTTNTLKQRYAACIVTAIMQRRSLGNPNVRGTDFMGNEHIELPANERRTRQVVVCKFYVEYEHVLAWKDGPATPVIDGVPWPWVPPPDVTVPDGDLGEIATIGKPIITPKK